MPSSATVVRPFELFGKPPPEQAILLRAVAETLRRLATDPRHLGAEIGFIAVPHSWGRTSTIIHISTVSCRAALCHSNSLGGLLPGKLLHARTGLCVSRRGGQVVVAEQNLDDTDVGSALQKMGGKAVAQRKHRHPFVDAGRGARRTAGRIQNLDVKGPGLVPARKQPDSGSPASNRPAGSRATAPTA